jgi:hypothetical protein
MTIEPPLKINSEVGNPRRVTTLTSVVLLVSCTIWISSRNFPIAVARERRKR